MVSYCKLFISVLLLYCAQPSHAQDGCNNTNTAYQSGEKLSFKVYYNMGMIWVGAGLASFSTTMETLNGRKVYHVVGDGKTLKSYEWFYKVRDRYETYIDAETLLPLKFFRSVNEGGFKFTNNVYFNQSANKATSSNGTFAVPRCIQDVLSSIFFARNIDYNSYTVGANIPFSMFLDDQVYKLHITYLGKEKITTKYGTFKAIKIKPLLISGTIFKEGDQMTIWISDDANHIPLRVDSPILVGSVKVDLVGYDKLRNPFSALINLK